MSNPLPNDLLDQARQGRLSRREVLRRGAALGLSAPALASLLAACGGSTASPTAATSSTTTAVTPAASAGTPAAAATSTTSAAAATPASTAAAATGGRGKGGQLKLLWWQAPTILNGHLAQGTKDFDASRVVLEPLADFDKDGNPVPILAAEIPSLANGGVAQDGMSVTWKLKPGVKWSDGQPFSSADVKFTYDYVSNKDTSATTSGSYAGIASVDTPDDATVKVTFKKPTPGWFTVFCGAYGYIVPQHVLKDFVGTNARNAPFNLKPIGTGPYKVDSFTPGDVVEYSVNDNFRDAGKPYFAQVNLKGGGDATSAARAAIQTGDVDYSWNLQVSADVLTSLQSGGVGALIITPGSSAEQIQVNMTDPNKDVNGERSHFGTPHPFQTDPAVRQAYALAVQRDVMASKLYGPAGTATANVLIAPSNFVSKNTSWKYDLAAAGKLLDDAGWVKGSDGIRAKGGVKMQVTFQTSVNQLRQQEQELVKASFQQLGIAMTLKSVDAGVYFSSDAGNPDTYAHFYTDLEMFTNGPSTPYPLDYMIRWYGKTDNIAQKSNSWSGNNITRWQNSDFDAAYEAALTELDPAKQAALFTKMNDLVVNDWVGIGEVARNGVSGAAKNLQNLNLSPWSSDLWNLAGWTRSS